MSPHGQYVPVRALPHQVIAVTRSFCPNQWGRDVARIVTLFSTDRRAPRMVDMSFIRWFKISEALGRLGHRVDIATGELKWWIRRSPVSHAHNVRRVPLDRTDWSNYDVIKTLFHRGFETLAERGGADHPFIISKLGSVVGPRELPGIHFHGERRRRLYDVQKRIADHSRCVTLLTEPAVELWHECFGRETQDVLLVPGATEKDVPEPGPDPYPDHGDAPRCLYAGSFYSLDERHSQPDAHRSITSKMNRLGRNLADRGMRLYVLGEGDHRQIDDRWVSYLGSVSYQESWDYLYHADVGTALVPGTFLHNNESTKLYHYLRVGLPVASEAGFPNDDLVRDAGLGFVAENGRMDLLAERVEEAVRRDWNRERAIRFILDHHTWEQRARVYDDHLRDYFI